MNEIKEVKPSEYAVMNQSAKDLQITLKENIGNQQLSAQDFDKIKVPSQGGTTWTVPTITGEEDMKELEGIIVFWKNPRGYWETDYDTNPNSPPTCFSEDGLTGEGIPGGNCATCPLNMFGSATDGSDKKACNEMRYIFLIRKNSILPVLIKVPVMSIKPCKSYFLRLASSGIPYYGVTTKITLEKDKNKGGIVYSKIVFAAGQILSADEREKMKQLSETLKPFLESVVVDAQDLDESAK